MRRALPFLFLLVFVFMTGCSQRQVKLERRPKFYRSLVSLSPSTTEILCSDADANTIKGRTASCNFPPNMMANIPVVASVKPDYELIQQVKPDMIVYDKGLYSDQDIEKLKGTGAELFGLDATTVEDFVKQLYVLGSKLAWETRFNDYIMRIETEKRAIEGTPYDPRPNVAIILPDASGNDLICGTDSFLADVVRITGGKLVGPKGSQFLPLSAENFVALDPDVIVTTHTKDSQVNPKLIAADPRFKTIKAVKTSRIRALQADVLLRKGQRVDDLIKAMRQVIGPVAN